MFCSLISVKRVRSAARLTATTHPHVPSAGDRRETDVPQNPHAVGRAVHLRRGPAHQAPHSAQRPVGTALPVALSVLRHQAFLPQRGADQGRGRVLHRPLREGPPGFLLHPEQRPLLHAVHEEQDGESGHTLFLDIL